MSRVAKSILVLTVLAAAGCHSGKPFFSFRKKSVDAPSTAPVIAQEIPTTNPVATSELGTIKHLPGLAPKPKPFIAVPGSLKLASGRPSTVLMEHASPDSPLPLSDFAKQPEYTVGQFHLRADLSAKEVQRLMGPPAQLADTESPWLVYRITGQQELWLHFTGLEHDHLQAADLIHGAEDGYVRNRVFSDDSK